MALFRVDFSGRGELADRQQKLAQMLSRLQKISEGLYIQYTRAACSDNNLSDRLGVTCNLNLKVVWLKQVAVAMPLYSELVWFPGFAILLLTHLVSICRVQCCCLHHKPDDS